MYLGVVGRHSALERKESENYLVPDNSKLMEVNEFSKTNSPRRLFSYLNVPLFFYH